MSILSSQNVPLHKHANVDFDYRHWYMDQSLLLASSPSLPFLADLFLGLTASVASICSVSVPVSLSVSVDFGS